MEYWNQITTLSSKPRGSLQVSIYKFLQTIGGEYITRKGQTTLLLNCLLKIFKIVRCSHNYNSKQIFYRCLIITIYIKHNFLFAWP